MTCLSVLEETKVVLCLEQLQCTIAIIGTTTSRQPLACYVHVVFTEENTGSPLDNQPRQETHKSSLVLGIW